MIETLRRPIWAIGVSITLMGLAAATSTRAQTAPGLGVQPMGPSSAVPQLPPSTFAPGPAAQPSQPSAPLATSAQSCQTYIAKISGERIAAINALNALAKANKGKLDPIAACPRFRNLVRVETEFRNYLVENKDWCGVPDNIVDTVSESTAKDASVSVKACALAVQFKKAQAQAAQSLAAQAPKLPAGPL